MLQVDKLLALCFSVLFFLVTIALFVFTDRGKNIYKRYFIWEEVYRDLSTVITTRSLIWYKGVGSINDIPFFFSISVNDNGIFLKNDHKLNEVIFLPWISMSLIERFSLRSKKNFDFIKIYFLNEIYIMCLPWNEEFEILIPGCVLLRDY